MAESKYASVESVSWKYTFRDRRILHSPFAISNCTFDFEFVSNELTH